MARAAVWVACLVAACPQIAAAQAASDEFGIERFRLSIDPDGVLAVDSATVPAHLAWSAGVMLGFAHDPLVVYDDQMSPVESLIDRRWTTSVVGAIGLYNRAEVAIGLDVVDYQHGSDTSPTMQQLPKGGLGDARLVGKVKIVEHLAFVPTLIVPIGSADGYLRESSVAFSPAIAVSLHHDRVRVAANVGYDIKKRVDVAGLVSDDEAFARIGAGLQTNVAELWASTSVAAPVKDRDRNQVAVEALLGAARAITARLDVFLGGGVGLDNGFGVPDWRAFAGVRIDTEQPKPAPIVVVEKPPVVEKPVAPPAPEPPKLATLRGRVVDKDGRAIVRATVSILGNEIQTNDDGRFETTYPGGPIELAAKANEYQPATTQANIAAGATGDVSITLKRSVRQGQLRGQVMSFAGKPLAATITVNGATAQTDSEGQFQIDLPEGAFEVTIESSGFTTQKRKVSVKLDGVTVLNVDLRGAK